MDIKTYERSEKCFLKIWDAQKVIKALKDKTYILNVELENPDEIVSIPYLNCIKGIRSEMFDELNKRLASLKEEFSKI